MTTAYLQALTQYQAGSGSIIGATTVVLTSLQDIYGNAITSMTPFGTAGFCTAEPDTNNEEAFIFTGITVNANGTVSLTGVSSILAQTPYTATSGLVRQHSGGTKVVITDNVAFWATFGNLSNANTWADVQTLSVPAVQATNPTLSTQVANKAYVDGVAVAGAPNASPTVKGIVQEATQAQVLAKTAAGSTGAELYVNPARMSSTLLSDYKVDTGAANAYVITPSPAITAYTVGQIFSFKAVNANTTASTLNVNALGAKTIKKAAGATDLASGDIAAGMVILVEYDGTNFIMLNPVANAPTASVNKFGGTGADGALAVSSGNTNIDCANAAVLVKNYTSISITGTGSITFINPHANGTVIILKSQGAVTLTSSTAPMIDASGMGAAGGTSASAAGGVAAGNAGNNGNAFYIFQTKGGGGGANSGPTGGTAGTVPTAIAPASFFTGTSQAILKYGAQIWVGGGGGSGGSTAGAFNGTTGAGGNGGGALIIECGGALNFTTASGISVAGKNGSNPGGTNGAVNAGGGGGGAGGMCLILYNTLTSNSGTITISGGTGGTNGSSVGAPTGGGSGATAYTAGAVGSTTISVPASTGASGASLVAANTDFV